MSIRSHLPIASDSSALSAPLENNGKVRRRAKCNVFVVLSIKPTTPMHNEDGGGPVTLRTGAHIFVIVISTYVVLVCGCLTYFFSELHRPGSSEDSALRVLNAGMQASWVLMVGVVITVVVFGLGVVAT